MKSNLSLYFAALTVLVASNAPAQVLPPTLRTTASIPALVSGSSFDAVLSGQPGLGFAILSDPAPGTVQLFGVDFAIGLSPSQFLLASGVVPVLAPFSLSVPVAASPSLLGVTLYHQAFELVGLAAPNGLFLASDGESTVFHGGQSAIVARFDDPVADGFTGTFDTSVLGRLRGGAVQARTQSTTVQPGVPFVQGLANPLNPNGSRTQMVYRPVDLGLSLIHI